MINPKSKEFTIDSKIIDAPNLLYDLLKSAQQLSKDLPQARVDFYIVDNNIYFGEITLSSLGGRMTYFTPAALKEMGDKITLPFV